MNKCRKIDIRTCSKAMIQFQLKDEGSWLVVRYEISHNHELCLQGQRHRL